jgi:hypothetical protein
VPTDALCAIHVLKGNVTFRSGQRAMFVLTVSLAGTFEVDRVLRLRNSEVSRIPCAKSHRLAQRCQPMLPCESRFDSEPHSASNSQITSAKSYVSVSSFQINLRIRVMLGLDGSTPFTEYEEPAAVSNSVATIPVDQIRTCPMCVDC